MNSPTNLNEELLARLPIEYATFRRKLDGGVRVR